MAVSDMPLWSVKLYEEAKRREEAKTEKANPQREEILEEPAANLVQLAAAGKKPFPVLISAPCLTVMASVWNSTSLFTQAWSNCHA